jgi:hypothetical protein
VVKKTISHDSYTTIQVRSLLERLYGTSPKKDSLLERALDFFLQSAEIQEKMEAFNTQISEEKILVAAAKKSDKAKLENMLSLTQRALQDYQQSIKVAANLRHTELRLFCHEILALTEGETREETLRKTAHVLGTIQLITPVEGQYVQSSNEKNKPLYRAILALRLLDEVVISKQLQNEHINSYLSDVSIEKYFKFNQMHPEQYQGYVENVKVAVLMSALLEDIGSYHHDAQQIIYGSGGDKDPYRVMDAKERKELLTITLRENLSYIEYGLGLLSYIGNSREDKLVFDKNEAKKNAFIKGLFKNSIHPKQGIGNLLKVPQIYASIIMSTKENYSYKVLPQVYNVLNLNAERGFCSANVVASLYKITGMFPQGYGIAYLPLGSDGNDMEFYEFAIVNQLYPEHPQQPMCRQATKNLTYLRSGNNVTINIENNMYFKKSAQKLLKVSKERLLQILRLLVSNFDERKDLDIIPRCWEPNDYFTVKDNQNLWTLLKFK